MPEHRIVNYISCATCGQPTTNNRYCSSSCAGKANTRKVGRPKYKKINVCESCGGPTTNNRFCNLQCFGTYNRKYDKKRHKPKIISSPERKEAQAKAQRARRYGLTLEQLDDLLSRSGDICLICRQKEKLVIDHCHNTGIVRGLICHRCNRMLGYAVDNVETLRNAAIYLEHATGAGTQEGL